MWRFSSDNEGEKFWRFICKTRIAGSSFAARGARMSVQMPPPPPNFPSFPVALAKSGINGTVVVKLATTSAGTIASLTHRGCEIHNFGCREIHATWARREERALAREKLSLGAGAEACKSSLLTFFEFDSSPPNPHNAMSDHIIRLTMRKLLRTAKKFEH